MKKSVFRNRVLSTALGLFFSLGLALAYVTDTAVYSPPNYYTFLPPLLGGSYTDPVFGTSIKRITDAPNTINLANGLPLPFITAEYSTMSPFNSDNSRIVLQYLGHFAIYDGDGNYVRDCPFEVNATSEPRWSRSDPNVLYYRRNNQLKQFNVASGAISVIRTFSEYASIYGMGESDICFDGNHFVFAGDKRYVFVYELSTNTKGPVLDSGGRAFDSLYITPNDNVSITWLQDGAARYSGVELFDRNMNFLRQLTTAGGHMDYTRDTNGDEVLVWTNARDRAPICNNGIVKVRLSDARQTCLISLDWSLATHTSAPDNSGWAFVETYAPSDPSPTTTAWKPYTNEILQVKLDGTEVRRLAHHRSRPFNTYNWTPRVSASRDGSRFVYSSNYGLQSLLGYTAEYTDVYLAILSASAPVPPPPPPPTSSSTATSINAPAVTYPSNANVTVTVSSTAGTPTGNVTLSVDGGTPITQTLASGSTTFILSSPSEGAHSLTANYPAQGDFAASSATGTLTVNPASPPPPPPPSGTPTRYEQDNAAVAYTGTWGQNSNTVLHSGGTAALSMDAGNRATFTFTGTGVSCIGYRDEWSGIAKVYLDGVLQATLDTYATPYQKQAVIYTVGGLTSASHTLVIEATGTRNTSSGGSWVWVDAFDVTSGSSSGGGIPQDPTVVRVEQTGSSLGFVGTWSAKTATIFSGGSAVFSMDRQAQAAFTFTGTGISWIGYKDQWAGIARVYLDGSMVTTVDTYAPTGVPQAVIHSISGLTRGTHKLVIDVTGRRNKLSGGAWIWVDAFDVTP